MDPARLFVRLDTFRGHLALLARRGWRALSLDEFLAALDGAPVPRKSFLVTIDDGHDSVPALAAPVLAEAGVPSVLFVPPAALGGPLDWNPAYAREQLASRDRIAALSGTGMQVGVHGWDHSSLSGMSAEMLAAQLRAAGDALETITGQRPKSFAYPYGDHDEAARDAVAHAGYSVGFAVARECGRFAVDRIGVTGRESRLMFLVKLSLGYRLMCRAASRLTWLRWRHRVPGWRSARRAGG